MKAVEDKAWWANWEITTHSLPMGLTVKEISLPNARAQNRIIAMYANADINSFTRDLTLVLESALTELGNRATPTRPLKKQKP